MGKPVISTPIEELKRFPEFVKIGKKAKEWETHIRELYSRLYSEKSKNEQKKLAFKNSWNDKFETISRFMLSNT